MKRHLRLFIGAVLSLCLIASCEAIFKLLGIPTGIAISGTVQPGDSVTSPPSGTKIKLGLVGIIQDGYYGSSSLTPSWVTDVADNPRSLDWGVSVPYEFADVPKGMYSVLAFIDLDKDGVLDPGEAFGTYPPSSSTVAPELRDFQSDLSSADIVLESETAPPVVTVATPSLPSPADAGSGIVLSTTGLDWADCAASDGSSVSYDLFIGTPDLPATASKTGLAVSALAFATDLPGFTLSAGTTYKWKVVAQAGAASQAGPTWSFTTAAAAGPTGKMAVLWADPDYPSYIDYVTAAILGKADGRFTVVDDIDLNATTPSLSTLEAYDAVLVYGNAGSAGCIKDSAAFGDTLADYVDSGRGVVIGAYSFFDPAGAYGATWGPQGRFASDGYYPVSFAPDYNGGWSSTATLLPDLPQHPILSGVGAFSKGWWNTGTDPVAGADLVAHYDTGESLLVAMEGPGGKGRVVAFNARPVPTSASANAGWDSTTDGGRVMANALCWAASQAEKHYLGNYDFRLSGSSDWNGTYTTSSNWSTYANVASTGDYLPGWTFALDPNYITNHVVDFQVRTAETGALDACIYNADTGSSSSGYGIGMSQTLDNPVSVADSTLKLKLRFRIDAFSGGSWGPSYFEAPVIVSLKVDGSWGTLKAYVTTSTSGTNGETVSASTWIERDVTLLGAVLSNGSTSWPALTADSSIEAVDISSIGWTHQILVDTVDLHR